MESRKGEKIRTRKRKPHIAHLLTLSLVWLILSAGGDVVLSAWQPPIGIPAPSFGIEETYRMYDNPVNRNPALTYTQNAEGGFYTHYVDNTHPNAINSNNPYGTASKPRQSLPPLSDLLPAGSILEIHGGPYPLTGSSFYVVGFGTSALPIFVRGVDTGGNTPYFVGNIHTQGTYLILEDLSSKGCYIMAEHYGQGRDSNYVSVRNNDFYSFDQSSGSVAVMGQYGSTGEKRADNVVVYNNKIHDFGDINTPEDDDTGGVSVSYFTHDVWVIDNEIYMSPGSGVQVNSGNYGPPLTTERVYVARNHIYNVRQAGVWIKYGKDVIFSQNKIHDIITRAGSISKGMGYQYHPQNAWYLFNEIYNTTYGFSGSSPNAMSPVYTYVIGNLIYNQKLYPLDPTPNGGYPGIGWSGNGYKYAIGNTIYNYRSGMSLVYPQKYIIMNNIIADVNESFYHLDINFVVAPNSILENNLFYQSDGPVVVNWGGQIFNDMDVLRAQTSTGQGCIVADPQFTDPSANDFHLQSTSPAICAGTSSGVVQQVFDRFQTLYGIDIRQDIERTLRTDPWDIGAYEGISSVDPTNPSPVLQAIGDKSVDENSLLTFDVNATDPNGEPITYSVQSLPSGATLDPQTGDFDWTPSYDQAGTYQVTFIADDGQVQDSETITITVINVNRTPVLAAINNQSVWADDPLTFTIDATDPDGDTVTYSAGTLPSGATFTGQDFDWTPSQGQIGTYNVTFYASDGQLQDSQAVTITVNVDSLGADRH